MADPTNSATLGNSLLSPFTTQEQMQGRYDLPFFDTAGWDSSFMDWNSNSGIDQTAMSLNPQALVSNPALGNTTISEGDMNVGNSVNPPECGNFSQDIEQKMEDRFQDIQKKIDDQEREMLAEMLTERVTNKLEVVIRDHYEVMDDLGKASKTYRRMMDCTVKLVDEVEQKTGVNGLSRIVISDI
ncbi:hypothetical protein HYALB_00008733 [Hymenoscyphus albidus]|uniref:Uncharacterized protein n=1 Tax=Hymenoscyphus albidus TaxID=595503 RepID=A0A9N9LUE5_9HELO|nr:hypothetical protein HYALB_00008733 [Hymenoscyphus albidus]